MPRGEESDRSLPRWKTAYGKGCRAFRARVERWAEGEGEMSKHNTKWTPEEDQRLLELKAAGTPLAVIAKKLDRTQASVDTRTSKLKYQAKGK
jgi:hypothetical protein